METPATAPAAPAPAAPASTPAPAPAAAPPGSPSTPEAVQSAGATGSTPDEAKLAPEQPKLTADTFGWDDWDGSEDSLPEDIRPWASRFNSFYMKDAEIAKQEAEKIRKVWEGLLEGHEDPRLNDLRKQLDTTGATAREHEQRYTKLQSEFDAYRAEIEKWSTEHGNSVAAKFQEANPWIFDNGPIQKIGAELLDENFEMDELPVLLRMPEEMLAHARKLHKELAASGAKNAGNLAIRLTRAEYQPPALSPSAQSAAGSTGAPPLSIAPSRPGTDADLAHLKDVAYARALRVHSR